MQGILLYVGGLPEVAMRLSLLALLAGLLVGAACAEGGDDQSDRAWPALALPHCAACRLTAREAWRTLPYPPWDSAKHACRALLLPCLCKCGQQG